MAYLYSPTQYRHFAVLIDHIGRPWPLTHLFSTGGTLIGFRGGKIGGQYDNLSGSPLLKKDVDLWPWIWPWKNQNYPKKMYGLICLGKTFNLRYRAIKSDDFHVDLQFHTPCLKNRKGSPLLKKNESKVNVVRFSRSMCQNVRIAKENENMQSHFQFFFQGQILDQKVQNRVICWPLTLDLTLKKSKLSPKNVWVDLSWQNLQFEISGDKIGWLSCWPSISHPLP